MSLAQPAHCISPQQFPKETWRPKHGGPSTRRAAHSRPAVGGWFTFCERADNMALNSGEEDVTNKFAMNSLGSTHMKAQSLGRITGGVSVALLALCFVDSIQAGDEPKSPNPIKNRKDGAEMILIPGGSFLMGSTKEEVDAQFRETGLPEDWKEHTRDEEPRHKRTLKPFYIYKYEVTNEQYKAFIDASGHRSPPHWKGKKYPTDKGNHPVVEVSWDDAQAYCRWAGTRLPSEAEWEYAARGAASADGKPSRAFPWGDNWDRKLCNNSSFHAGKDLQNADDWNEWYKGDQKSRYPLTSPGGSFPKSVSPFGVHDMAGNAWEWCAEIHAPYPQQKPDDAKDKKMRARRGGSWANVALHIRSADRQPAAQGNLNLYTGFRCVKNP